MTTATAATLSTFNFKTNAIRIIDRGGQPWFVAADVCRVLDLGWDKSNNVYAPSRLVRHLAGDEKASSRIANKGQPHLIISESGLYKLIMRSDKPEAVAFQEWVTREVLPAIRKTGGYMLAGADREAIHEGQDKDMPEVARRRRLRGRVRGECAVPLYQLSTRIFGGN